MVGLSDLSFDPRAEFGLLVSHRFNYSVSPSPSSSVRPFVLIASFGCSTLCLNVDSVGLMLQASIGGVAKDFDVVHLSGWMFHFSVSCKEVGFMIYKLKTFICKHFAIFFFSRAMGDQISIMITPPGVSSRMLNRQ